MTSLLKALPDLVSDIESALIRIGRGDLADQLREVELEKWTYDDFADAGYLYLRSRREVSALDRNMTGASRGETVCPFEDLAINLDLDKHRRLIGIALPEARSIIGLLEKNIAGR